MNICVLNGSPKGKDSITLQTCLFLEKIFKAHTFTYLPIAQKIKVYEKNMTEPLEAIKKADLLLFAYPVYTFLAPSQVHRFIELLKQNSLDLKDKFATQITTSKHFYDVTAHTYLEENLQDLGLKVIHGLSADMEDLTSKQGQEEAVSFFKYLEHCIKNNLFEPFIERKQTASNYEPSLTEIEKKEGKLITIVSNVKEEDVSLKNKINDFIKVSPYPVKIINLRDFPFSGGCLGCLRCALQGKCIYKDGFDTLLNNEILKSDAIIYAFTIQDHCMGSLFKMYDDRQFCNGHRTVSENRPVGYLIQGDIDKEPNLKMVLEARSQVGHNFLAGFGMDKESISLLSNRLTYALEKGYTPPRNFNGVGGLKIFRDLIYLMRGIMKDDYLFYKKHKMLDFPQKKRGQMLLLCLLGKLLRNKKLQKKIGNKMNEGMLAPYKKVLTQIDEKAQ